LQGTGPFTVFAPTNAAFAAAGVDVNDVDTVAEVLKYHVISGVAAFSNDLSEGQLVTTVQGEQVRVSLNRHKVYINNAKVQVADVEATNGVVHIIDEVLMPPASIVDTAVATEDLSTLVAVLTTPAYSDVLGVLGGEGPFTVFAPTNEAFAAAGLDVTDVQTVTDVLLYHVVAGATVYSSDLTSGQMVTTAQGSNATVTISHKQVYIDDSKVVIADVLATNGVVHVIDSVLMPPKSIVETAIKTEALSTLVTVLSLPEYAPVLDALSGGGPFTVFAPTNEAFAAAGVDTTNVAAVTEVLKYHVIAGVAAYSDDLERFQLVPTLQGASVEVVTKRNWSGRKVYVDDAKVIQADVRATNGVVHVIDAVLIPPKPIVDIALEVDSLSTLVSVLTLPEYEPVLAALQGSGPFTVFAPTNEAFAAAGVDVTDIQAVTEVLQYHVLPEAVYTDTARNGDVYNTLQGSPVKFFKSWWVVKVNDAQVQAKDVRASNGVVHVIDSVLLRRSPWWTRRPRRTRLQRWCLCSLRLRISLSWRLCRAMAPSLCLLPRMTRSPRLEWTSRMWRR